MLLILLEHLLHRLVLTLFSTVVLVFIWCIMCVRLALYCAMLYALDGFAHIACTHLYLNS
jgi:hypothetical protein